MNLKYIFIIFIEVKMKVKWNIYLLTMNLKYILKIFIEVSENESKVKYEFKIYF